MSSLSPENNKETGSSDRTLVSLASETDVCYL
ncbi:unnamed protein product, partial [Rotaria sp. Silwood1]